jgi:CheY-like chemotaxis protein/anti-sigma regulatory factor (Ser/Thr protein kinase)
MQRLAPRSFIEAAVETIKPTAEAKGVHLKQRVDPHAGPLCGDANRLQQVVWNLLSNAVKFTPAGGTVELTLEPIDSQLELTVADTGQGISPDFLPYVFDRFRQADATITRRYKGLGLGLAIVKQLVELHGGTVRVHSDGEDRGATFVVSLPLPISQDRGDGNLPQDADSNSDGEHNGKLIDLSGLRIVVVDDEPDACLLIKQVLDRCHAVVLTASSAAEAIPLVEMSHPDILISDIGMPHVDGYELLRRIRSLQPDRGGQVPAIALTAFARPEDRTRSLAAGYSMHVSKPIEPEKLTATVAHLAGRTNHCGAIRAD